MPSRMHSLLLSLMLAPPLISADEAPDLGARIAQQGSPKGAAPCLTCHGPDGAGVAAAGYPRIAGLDADQMIRQLQNFRDGSRDNPIMKPMAAALSDAEIAAVSAYYAALPVPSVEAAAPSGDAAKTARDLVEIGDWHERSLPGCARCHGPDGNGIGAYFPGLAGQHALYIENQLKAWQGGQRKNDQLGLMKAVADRLSAEEITAVAAWYAALPGGKATPAGNAPDATTPQAEIAADQVRADPPPQYGAPPKPEDAEAGELFMPPSRDAIPDTPFGEAIRTGEAMFQNTNAHPESSKYVGNGQACGNCHLDAGRLANSSPLWAAWVSYPAYRTKNKRVNTFIERIQGCFSYSMNAQASKAGGAPSADSDTMVGLVTYAYWLAKGAPTGNDRMAGRGYARIDEPADGFDPKRGAKLYAEKCAFCHGDDGAGVSIAGGETLFPALWGRHSYNWGAGMHKIDTAAAFVKANMPLGLPGSLSDQEAWDLAAYMNSHERPQDPRHQGDLDATTKAWHGGKYDYYGTPNGPEGKVLGANPAQ